MLKKEILKNEEEEVANAQERLVDSSENKNQENENKNDEDKTVEKELAEEDDESDVSEKVEEEIKEQQADNPNEPTTAPNDDLNGSTVEIVQPADLKPRHLGFTRNLLLAMFAAMIGTGAQFGYALGVMNAPSDVIIRILIC